MSEENLQLRFKEGELVGGYRLKRLLGRGGFSEVWRAQPPLPPPPPPPSDPWLIPARPLPPPDVALKILIHDEFISELRKESKALSLVRGDGIVRILDANLDHEPPYLALTLFEGGDLRTRLRESSGKTHPSNALRLVERLLETLSRVHREGVVHGDLKPENVLFDAHGYAFLADFGLSRRISQRSATLSVSLSLADARLAGTIEYMAPEQREGAKPTVKSDVYAIGVLLHELLTGERPQGLMELPGKRDPGLPPLIDRTLAGALALDPRDRFEDAGSMLKFIRLGLWNDGQALRATRDGLRDRWVIAAHYGSLWWFTLLFLCGISLNEIIRNRATSLAFLTGLLAAAIPIVLAMPFLRRWNKRVTKELARVERQLEILRGWREADALKVVEAMAPEVAQSARRRRGAVRWFWKLLRVSRKRLRRKILGHPGRHKRK